METGKEMAREAEGNRYRRWRYRQTWDRDTEKHKDRDQDKDIFRDRNRTETETKIGMESDRIGWGHGQVSIIGKEYRGRSLSREHLGEAK